MAQASFQPRRSGGAYGRKQVYAVITQGNDIIITQKALQNAAFQSHGGNPNNIVNQAGQYALPGGGMEPKDNNDPITTAIRETFEETGIQLIDINNRQQSPPLNAAYYQNAQVHNKKDYSWVVFELEQSQDIYQIVVNMNQHIKILLNQPSPHAEHAKIFVQGKGMAKKLLGNYLEINNKTHPNAPTNIIEEIKKRKNYWIDSIG